MVTGTFIFSEHLGNTVSFACNNIASRRSCRTALIVLLLMWAAVGLSQGAVAQSPELMAAYIHTRYYDGIAYDSKFMAVFFGELENE
jgi:hypothetical protein